MRLDKFISHSSGLSRVNARKAIKAGRVAVDNETTLRSNYTLQAAQDVCLDGQLLAMPANRYIMLHKPAGYVCATTDSDNPTVVDLMGDPGGNLSIAGRLDKDTTGLVLLSDDGQWIHAATSPRRQCSKTYYAELDARPDEEIIRRFAEGLLLKGECKVTRPASLKVLGERRVEVTISEGRYHQIKRMFASCGLHVQSLHRYSIGPIVLDSSLAPGEWRDLSPEEVNGIHP